jgi:hypothetical protein
MTTDPSDSDFYFKRRLRRWFAIGILALLAISAARLRSHLLVQAARAGNVPLGRFLILVGADPDAAMFGFHDWDDAGWRLAGLPVDHAHRRPAVMEAARYKHLPMLRLLLSAGADPDASDGTGSTALWTAVDDNDRESVRLLLLAGADPNARWKDNSTILGNLPDHPDPQILKMLEQAGAGY